MKITIESTEKTVLLQTDTGEVPARMWQGETESGIPVFCFVTRIVPEITEADPHYSETIAEFDRDLRSCVPAESAGDEFEMRLII
jgi:hypothetical protein